MSIIFFLTFIFEPLELLTNQPTNQPPPPPSSYDQMIGPLSVDDLLSRLMNVMEEHDAVLVGERLELEERAANRNILQQQGGQMRRPFFSPGFFLLMLLL